MDTDASHAMIPRDASALRPTSPHEVRECVSGIAKISTSGDSFTKGSDTPDGSSHNSSSDILSSSESGVTQEEGERSFLEICKSRGFPELFDGKQGLFRGIQARIYLKEGHEQYLKVIKTSSPY